MSKQIVSTGKPDMLANKLTNPQQARVFELSRWRDGRCGVGCPRTLLVV
jgi:hypothetical protein